MVSLSSFSRSMSYVFTGLPFLSLLPFCRSIWSFSSSWRKSFADEEFLWCRKSFSSDLV